MRRKIWFSILALALAASFGVVGATPAAATPPTVASQIQYYTVGLPGYNSGTWTRSTSAMSVSGTGGSTASQTVNGDGSVTISLSGVPSGDYADNGFYLPAGTLGNLEDYTVSCTGTGTVYTNLFLG